MGTFVFGSLENEFVWTGVSNDTVHSRSGRRFSGQHLGFHMLFSLLARGGRCDA